MLIEAAGDQFLFDCGRGTSIRLTQYNPKLASKVDKVFLTHLHSDHIVGLPSIWLNGWTLGRRVPLKVYGSIGTSNMLNHIRQAYSADIDFRTHEGATNLGTDIIARNFANDGVVYHENGVRITAFLVDHGPVVKPAFGYVFEYRGHKVVFSGDTTVAPNLTKNADILLLEVLDPLRVEFIRSLNFLTPEAREKIISRHLVAEQAAIIFDDAKPRLGVYYHVGDEPESEQKLVPETRKLYQGPLIVSKDLMQFQFWQQSQYINIVDVSPPRQ